MLLGALQEADPELARADRGLALSGLFIGCSEAVRPSPTCDRIDNRAVGF
jgi:hypothetical protein